MVAIISENQLSRSIMHYVDVLVVTVYWYLKVNIKQIFSQYRIQVQP